VAWEAEALRRDGLCAMRSYVSDSNAKRPPPSKWNQLEVETPSTLKRAHVQSVTASIRYSSKDNP
jgi:hypothetical protein